MCLPAGLGLVAPAAGGGAHIYATWNPADVGANVTLSNGNLTARRTSGSAYGNVRSTLPLTGKHYWEDTVTWAGTAGDRHGIGVATASLPLTGSSSWVGANTTNAGLWDPGNDFYFNSSTVTSGADSGLVLVTRMLAFDAATRKIWAGIVGVGWLNGGDPAAGTGEVATLAAGTYYAARSGGANDVEGSTANFGATAFAGSVPSGFAAGIFT